MANLMGNRICQKRTELGLTMEELGTMVGVKSSAVNKWEKGIVENIKRDTIQEMARIFNCSPVWLMGYDAPEKLEEVSKSAIQDAELVKKFHKLNDRDKTIILNMIDSMLCQ